MSHDRDLEISDLDEEELVTRSRVKGLSSSFFFLEFYIFCRFNFLLIDGD